MITVPALGKLMLLGTNVMSVWSELFRNGSQIKSHHTIIRVHVHVTLYVYICIHSTYIRITRILWLIWDTQNIVYMEIWGGGGVYKD